MEKQIASPKSKQRPGNRRDWGQLSGEVVTVQRDGGEEQEVRLGWSGQLLGL